MLSAEAPALFFYFAPQILAARQEMEMFPLGNAARLRGKT